MKQPQEIIDPLRQLLVSLIRVKEIREYINLRWINITVALQIRAMRQARGWSQAELARQSELSIITIGRLEKLYWGKVSPGISTLLSIASAFKVGMICNFQPWSQVLDQICVSPHLDTGLRSEFLNPPSLGQEISSGSFPVEK